MNHNDILYEPKEESYLHICSTHYVFHVTLHIALHFFVDCSSSSGHSNMSHSNGDASIDGVSSKDFHNNTSTIGEAPLDDDENDTMPTFFTYHKIVLISLLLVRLSINLKQCFVMCV